MFSIETDFQPVPVFVALQSAVSLINWGLDAVQNIDHKAGQRSVEADHGFYGFLLSETYSDCTAFATSRCISQLSVFVLSVFAVSSVLLHLPPSCSSGTSWMTLHVLFQAIVKYVEVHTPNQCVKAK